MDEVSADEAGDTPATSSYEGVPTWVKALVITVVSLIVLFLVLHLSGAGGGHGPSSH